MLQALQDALALIGRELVGAIPGGDLGFAIHLQLKHGGRFEAQLAIHRLHYQGATGRDAELLAQG